MVDFWLSMLTQEQKVEMRLTAHRCGDQGGSPVAGLTATGREVLLATWLEPFKAYLQQLVEQAG